MWNEKMPYATPIAAAMASLVSFGMWLRMGLRVLPGFVEEAAA